MTPPAGVHSLLTLGQTARVLNLGERTVKGWVERGILRHVQPTGHRGKRLVPSVALEDFALRHGLPLDWEAAL